MENTRTSSYYECTFCKRGFTNAQALGGHMNIHRKGKSKLKPESPKSKPNPNFPSLNCTSTAIPPRTFHDHQVQMDKYFSTTHIPPPPPPPPPPSLPCASFGAGGSGLYYSHMCYYSPLPTSLPCNPNCPPAGQLGFHGGDPGFNLNMQIGSSRTRGYEDREEEIKEVQDGEDAEDDDDDGVVDLELRLGRPPRRR